MNETSSPSNLERASAQVVATEFGGGDFRSALDVRSNNDRYWFGAFLSGPNSGALHTAGASCRRYALRHQRSLTGDDDD
jgi:hypothetical protein